MGAFSGADAGAKKGLCLAMRTRPAISLQGNRKIASGAQSHTEGTLSRTEFLPLEFLIQTNRAIAQQKPCSLKQLDRQQCLLMPILFLPDFFTLSQGSIVNMFYTPSMIAIDCRLVNVSTKLYFIPLIIYDGNMFTPMPPCSFCSDDTLA